MKGLRFLDREGRSRFVIRVRYRLGLAVPEEGAYGNRVALGELLRTRARITRRERSGWVKLETS